MPLKAPQFLNFLSSPARCLAIAAAVALVACATPGGNTAEEAVMQRANARWKLLVARDFAAAYDYNTATFKSLVTLDTFKSRTGASVLWLDAEAVGVKCPDAEKPEKCTARIRIDFKPTLRSSGDKFSTYVDETWLLEAGQWSVFEPVQGN